MDQPTYRNGKICYVEIPARDPAQSAEFYVRVFGWSFRTRGDGSLAFDDTVGQVSGSFVRDRDAARETGVMVYVMVADAVACIDAIKSAGGEIVREIDPNAHEVFAWFRDPAGSVLGIYQQPGLTE